MVEVAVVGAGVVGSSIAYELAARGVSVVLIDSRGVGLGATQAAAGMLAPYIEGVGKPILGMAVRSLAMYDEFIGRVSQDSGIAIGYQRTGSLQVASAGESLDELNALAACAKTAGIECALLDGAQTSEAEPQLARDVAGGLLIPVHGFVVASDLSRALVTAATKYGARLRAGEPVYRIIGNGARFQMQFERDSLTASHVVVAAGSWSGQIDIVGVPPLPVRPVRGQLLLLNPDAPPLRRITWGTHSYLVPIGPSTLLVGATVEEAGFDERSTVAGVHDLLEGASNLVPRLRQATFGGARVGLRPATPDGLPVIGRSQRLPGLVFATGHFRNGVLLAPLTAKVIADLILENRDDEVLRTASPQRFGEC